RYFSGLTVEMFFRRTSLVEYSQEALMTDLPHIECFAKCEGLDGHGRSATIRRG
ncbi:MAG: histidinol dehydrogenase, partial [Victivallales bacterium]|nr:histidinol dehydrogenase [Victivallales bacterium]